MNKKKYFILILCIGVFYYLCTGLKNEQPAEDLGISAGFGSTLVKQGEKDIVFVTPSSVYNFEEDEKISSALKTGEGRTPAQTRENRQLVTNKQYILGLEKVYLYSQAMATEGLGTSIEMRFREPDYK